MSVDALGSGRSQGSCRFDEQCLPVKKIAAMHCAGKARLTNLTAGRHETHLLARRRLDFRCGKMGMCPRHSTTGTRQTGRIAFDGSRRN
jgi:hypothetical protein